MSNQNAVVGKQRTLTKKEVAKIKAGTWIEVWWDGSPNTAVLLLEEMDNRAGEVSLKCYDPTEGYVHHSATNRQVVAVLGNLQVPATTYLAILKEDENDI